MPTSIFTLTSNGRGGCKGSRATLPDTFAIGIKEGGYFRLGLVTKMLLKVHLLAPDFRGYVPDWVHEECGLCVFLELLWELLSLNVSP